MPLQKTFAWTKSRNTCPHFGYFYKYNYIDDKWETSSIVARGKPSKIKKGLCDQNHTLKPTICHVQNIDKCSEISSTLHRDRKLLFLINKTLIPRSLTIMCRLLCVICGNKYLRSVQKGKLTQFRATVIAVSGELLLQAYKTLLEKEPPISVL